MKKRTLLVIEDDSALREAVTEVLMAAGYNVISVSAAEEAIGIINKKICDLIISDVEMRGMKGDELLNYVKQKGFELPVILMTAYGTIQQAVNAMHAGASEYLVKPFEAETLINTVKKYLSADVDEISSTMISENSTVYRLYNLAAKVARSDVSVLINGESGSGKEVLAKFIHQNSSRSDNPFVAINCAAIPENMLEAVLFGYEKGAFTGAYQRNSGKFEQAQKGTLLLDEISEMDLGLQAKLLRVLQEKEVERLGGRELIKLDVRVLATTNRDLGKEVKEGRFRQDLFYRLNVFPLTLPPLRERREDIAGISEQFIERFLAKTGRKCRDKPGLSNAAIQKLMSHGWPGNIRELENVIQRALVVYQGSTIEPSDIVLEGAPKAALERVISEDEDLSMLPVDLKRHEQDLILQALEKGNGSRKFAAQTLGISPRTLRYKLSKMRERGVKIPSAYGMA